MDETTLGLIAGNGRFPFMVLEEARRRGLNVVVAAIREEADPALDEFAGSDGAGGRIEVHWLGVGQLGRLLRILKRGQVRRAMMAGQVRHPRIFARTDRSLSRKLSALPDLKMLKALLSLPRKNTSSLIGAFAEILAKEGIELVNSTELLGEMVPGKGVLTARALDREEERDVEVGRRAAREIVRLDIGQTVVIKDQAIVAVEAMEGTDQTVRRAAALAEGGRLTVVKAGRADLRFDVPVLGLDSLKVFRECSVTAVAVEAGRTLVLDREEWIAEADRMNLALVALEAEE